MGFIPECLLMMMMMKVDSVRVWCCSYLVEEHAWGYRGAGGRMLDSEYFRLLIRY